MEEAQALLYRAFEAAKGDVERLEPSWRTVEVTMYAQNR